ncbi:hydrolase [Bacillus sp. AFS077874]|uniref:HAD family hydrolase n=1 Tax=unclassified Bacillus (in: firmicutes) TaxID=185979 RepID=UPI000BEB94D0|nr:MULTISPECIES: HAD hydrolase-like protein [unclassified Bacillus (in: firmicutes)]PEC51859.1 hydrolase [Bacillus sp. AFS096315]PFM79059.1 hydrolase [Bacillus sp. AFS077874]
MNLKYKCIILDHDDTAVMSTPEIHYPSFVEAIKKLRPNDEPISFEEFVGYCFEPGFHSLCKDIMKFNEDEMIVQQEIWQSYTSSTIPDFYEKFPETIKKFKERGGIITVVSHSERSRIERDYLKHCGFIPDAIFGWELPERQRKPYPYPIKEILRRFNLKESDALMLDDLKPGLEMAKSCHVDFAAAGWSHNIPEIKQQMKNESTFYFETIDEFSKFLLG